MSWTSSAVIDVINGNSPTACNWKLSASSSQGGPLSNRWTLKNVLFRLEQLPRGI